MCFDINHGAQVSVKEKQLMQKFFIAPKELAAAKPQVVIVWLMFCSVP